MKRTPLPPRKTPLRSRSPLRSRTRPKHGYEAIRRAVLARDSHTCQRCGRPGSDVHHRKLRSRGGEDSMENLVTLDRECHEWAHRNVAEATAAGWLVPSWEKAISAAYAVTAPPWPAMRKRMGVGE